MALDGTDLGDDVIAAIDAEFAAPGNRPPAALAAMYGQWIALIAYLIAHAEDLANLVDPYLGAGGGEVNTGANVGAAGTGVFDGKVGVELQFRKVRAASNKVTVALNAQQVDVDVAPANFTGIPQSGVTSLTADLDLKAPLASPALTGNPTAPTPAASDNDTSIATTAFVQGEIAAKAPLASPALTGNPTSPTPATSDNDTSIATTAHVHAALAAFIPPAGMRGIYGDGVDGNVTIVAGTTTLTRNMYYGDLTIDAGGVLETDGYAITVRGTLTNNGTIRRLANPGNAGNVGSGAGGTTTTANTRPLGNAAAGGLGGIQSGAAGSNTSGYPRLGNGNGGDGGQSNQGAYSVGNGGSSGKLAAADGDGRDVLSLSRGIAITANGVNMFRGGSGGGGGAGAAASADGSGGGGGAGGQVIVIVARVIDTSGGAIEAKGGNGGAGTGALGAGGGGGGGGGVVLVVSESYTGGAANVNGGDGGAGIGTGVSGANGSIGIVLGPVRA